MAAHVTIEARDLDTDERSRTVVEAVGSTRPHEQRAELAELVSRRHPGARIRSFADGAATFLDSQRLIVASYDRTPAGRRRAGDVDRAAQAPLFVT